jgi:hypothetical protein
MRNDTAFMDRIHEQDRGTPIEPRGRSSSLAQSEAERAEVRLWIACTSQRRFVLGEVDYAKPVEFLGGRLGTVGDAGVDKNVHSRG